MKAMASCMGALLLAGCAARAPMSATPPAVGYSPVDLTAQAASLLPNDPLAASFEPLPYDMSKDPYVTSILAAGAADDIYTVRGDAGVVTYELPPPTELTIIDISGGRTVLQNAEL